VRKQHKRLIISKLYLKFAYAQVSGGDTSHGSKAAIILADSREEIQKFNPKTPLDDYIITHKSYSILNKRLKFVEKGEALFYWN
jgi:hypothetical protein